MYLKIIAIALVLTFHNFGSITDAHNHHILRKQQQTTLIVETNRGKVLGKHEQTESGTKYLTFQGIPYAKPPINELRFQLPQEFSWEGTWNATFERNECVQAFPGFLLPVRGREDCLYLNIYTTKLGNSNELRPVMVWIYGGSYLYGSGNKDIYSPNFFLERDMVVVTFNYRLGVFGFLSTGDEIMPGNIGLKDQIFALKWLQENIRSFGGDPHQITIMGESAGAASVGHLIQSDRTKGLFHQAIMQSSTPIGLVSPDKMKKGLLLLGQAFGVANGTSKDIIDKLRTIDYVSLLLYSVVVADATKESIFDCCLYGPVLEHQSASAVITRPRFEQLKNCQFDSVPLIVGFDSEEALTYAKYFEDQRHTFIILDQNPQSLVPKELDVKSRCNPRDIGKKIKEHYVGKNGSFVYSQTGVIRYASAVLFMNSLVEYAKRYSHCNENTYLYRFSYNGGKNTTGAGHADELRYLFATFPVVNLREPFSETDAKVSKNMVGLWSNFMKSGNPTPNPNNFGVTWGKSLAGNNYEYIDIDEKLSIANMENAPFRNDVAFWESLYNTCGRVEKFTYN